MSILRTLAKISLTAIYLVIPIFGWIALARSIKRVEPGYATQLSKLNGDTEILYAGLHYRPFIGDRFSVSKSLASDYIDFGQMKIVTIPAGHVGASYDKGEMKVLVEGRHILEHRQHTFDQANDLHNLKDKYIDLGPKKIVTIDPGFKGVSYNQGVLGILEPGIHTLEHARHTFDPHTGFVDISPKYVELGPMKRVTIKPGFKGISFDRGVLNILDPGVHILEHAQHTFDPQTGFVDVKQNQYSLGPKTYIRVKAGQLGVSYKQGVLDVLQPGEHVLETANHKFFEFVSIDSDIIDLGPVKIVNVNNGNVAVVYEEGKLAIKEAGRYRFSLKDNQRFSHLLSVKDKVIDLPQIKFMSTDGMEMETDPLLKYRIVDPVKAVTNISDLEKSLIDLAQTTLQNILKRYSLRDLSPAYDIDTKQGKKNSNEEALQKIHDEFISDLQKQVEDWGVEVGDLKVKEVVPTSAELKKKVQELGSKTATQDAQRKITKFEIENSNAKIQSKADQTVISAQAAREAQLIDANTKAEMQVIGAEAEAKKTIVKAKAEAEMQVIGAQAEATKITVKAEANAGATKLEADAESKKKILLADADGRRLEVLGKATELLTTKTGQQLALGRQDIERIRNTTNPVFYPQVGGFRAWGKGNDGRNTFFRNGNQNQDSAISNYLDVVTTKNLMSQQGGNENPAIIIGGKK